MNLIKKIRLEPILGGGPDSLRMYLLELSSQGCKVMLHPKILDSGHPVGRTPDHRLFHRCMCLSGPSAYNSYPKLTYSNQYTRMKPNSPKCP